MSFLNDKVEGIKEHLELLTGRNLRIPEDFFCPYSDDCRIQNEELFSMVLDASDEEPRRFADNSGYYFKVEYIAGQGSHGVSISISGEAASRFEERYWWKYGIQRDEEQFNQRFLFTEQFLDRMRRNLDID